MKVGLEQNSDILRSNVKTIAGKYRAAWIELGQYLYAVLKDKHFKQWGYLSFDTYCVKELSIKSTTAQKILKSYSYLEKEEPRLVDAGTSGEPPQKVPDYESVNILRLASQNETFTKDEISEIRKAVIDEVREPKELRRQVRAIVTEKKENMPGFEEMKRQSLIKRMISHLKNASLDLKKEQMIPNYLLQQIETLIEKLSDQLT